MTLGFEGYTAVSCLTSQINPDKLRRTSRMYYSLVPGVAGTSFLGLRASFQSCNVQYWPRTGDFLRTITDAEDDLQLFWEAFPAEGGSARTTYMFAYCDTDRQRPSIEVSLVFGSQLRQTAPERR